MIITGTIGSEAVVAEVKPTTFTLTQNNKTLMDTLWVVCFQRVSTTLKTCDVVWVNGDVVHVQTIARACLSELRSHLTVPMFDIGSDPAPWKRWQAIAQKEQWQLEDWKYFLTPESESESEWSPGSGSEYSSGSDYDSDSS